MNKKDKILIVSILIIACFLFAAMNFGDEDNATRAKITVDGEVYGIYKLSDNQRIEIDNEYGHNVVCIENDRVFMEEADCPDELCKKQGEITKVNQTIVCLPHKLVVELLADETTSSQDLQIDAYAK